VLMHGDRRDDSAARAPQEVAGKTRVALLPERDWSRRALKEVTE
jgi:hypothetical protein